MEIIYESRRCGKTTELIKLSNKTWTYILCTNMNEAKNIAKLAQELNIDIPFPITVSELPCPQIKRVLIDNVDRVLMSILEKDVLGISLDKK